MDHKYLIDSSEPWVVYRTLKDIFELDETDDRVIAAKADLLANSLIKGLIGEMQGWPGTVLNSHKSASQLYHKLAFLADVGLSSKDADFSLLIKNLAANISEEGLYRLPINVPSHFGGTGTDQWGWALCDAPLLLYSAIKMDLLPKMPSNGLDYLVSLARDNGWPCKVSKELGNFRGPGKKDDPCPYATLVMLKLLALIDRYKGGTEVRAGAESLLTLWEKSREQHPYMFYMGTDFRKLKAPYIWYDILHVAEILSQYDFAARDERFKDMLDLINSKACPDGTFTPESEWTAWKDSEIAPKKKPSAWMTFLIYRINKRALDINQSI